MGPLTLATQLVSTAAYKPVVLRVLGLGLASLSTPGLHAAARTQRDRSRASSFSPDLFFLFRPVRSQVSITLAAVGKPGIEKKDALGYELDEDASEFLRTVEPPEGKP